MTQMKTFNGHDHPLKMGFLLATPASPSNIQKYLVVKKVSNLIMNLRILFSSTFHSMDYDWNLSPTKKKDLGTKTQLPSDFNMKDSLFDV